MEIADSLIKSGGIDVLVIDSVAALVPRAELEGDMGDSLPGLQARLMSQALRKLTSSIAQSNTLVVFINQLRMKIGVMFGSPETTTGGNALKFYSSVRLDIRRIGAIKEKDLDIVFSFLSDFESKGQFLPIEIQSEVNFRKEYETNGFITEKASRYVLVSKDEEVIGLTWVFTSVPYFDAVEIGYHVFDKSSRNKGYATEAVNALVNYLFESKQLNRIEIRIDRKSVV